MAEVVRAQSQALIAIVVRDNPQHHPAPLTLTQPNPNSAGAMVINERVGSISVAQWEGMSDVRLRELDRILTNVVNMTLKESTGLMHIARTARADLAFLGLVFKSVGECLTLNNPRDWARARDTSLPELVRMMALASASRPAKDGCEWWIDEMMRVVVRLMELRGM